MANPNVLVNGSSTLNGIDVDEGDVVNISLIEDAGVNYWELDLWSSNRDIDLELVKSTLVINQITKSATFVFPSSKGIILVKSIVNSGLDKNGVSRPEYTSNFAINCRYNGLRFFAPNETYENSASHGWSDTLCELVQGSGVGGGPSFTAAGDLSGSSSSQTVIGLQGRGVSSTLPTHGQALVFLGTTWTPTTIAGDLQGSAANPAVIKINGVSVPAGSSLTTGNSLYVNGGTSMNYSALNLAGGSGWVTGVLPSANLFQATTGTSGAVRLTNNLGGTAASPTVVGLTIPSQANGDMLYFNGTSWVRMAGGTAGNILTANGAAAPTYNNFVAGVGYVQSKNYRLETSTPASGNVETFLDKLSTVNANITTARTLSPAVGKGIQVTVVATATDGYTGYGTTGRITQLIKVGKFLRYAGGTLVRDGGSTDQYIHSNYGTVASVLEVNLLASGTTISINVTGQNTFNATWIVETTVRTVDL